MVNANTDGGVVADTASTLPAQNNTNDDPFVWVRLLWTRPRKDSDHDRDRGGGAWNASAATAGSHKQRMDRGSTSATSRQVLPDNAPGLCHRLRRLIPDVASALPDDLDDEFGSSDSGFYDSYNMNNGGEDWDDYNNYSTRSSSTGAAATGNSRFNQVLDAPSFFPGEGYSNAAYDSSHPHQSSRCRLNSNTKCTCNPSRKAEVNRITTRISTLRCKELRGTV